ncbi:DUF4142 domain-containing protein [Rhodocytophaga aerolata]|uniref:DUF4142 domain-containing protein n=1 Tax=Rhodocytophaga aerolata TaxID=455078 RepID=A0ABT8RF11_9BACT|nr:DUF4142 domain-containing protein [Rhodocytophaga aerolata]MDO1450689.1 DUF4142 domain-containing protein [Rhodocytophaga aerolata]
MKTYSSHKLFAPFLLLSIIAILKTVPLFAEEYVEYSQLTENSTPQRTISQVYIHKDTINQVFVETVSQSNLFQIELGKLALQKALSEEIKEYAQVMIEHHTMMQTDLASIIIHHPSAVANVDPINDADKLSTLGGTGGTTGNATAEGMTNGKYNSNLPAEEASVSSKNRPEPSVRENMPVNSTKEEATPSAPLTSSQMSYHLPTELSAAQGALRIELAKLSGAQFEKQYIQLMSKEHVKAIELYEKLAIDTDKKDDQLVKFASKNLPLIKKHYEMAKELSSGLKRR